jgi:very-short-patch-repair endonuclease
MGQQVTTVPFERRLAALARRQQAMVSHVQLKELGLGASGIAKRARSGRLSRMYRGVYHAGHGPPTRKGRFMAAVLACGDGAVLSHRSAAVLWGLMHGGPEHPEVTVPRNGGRGHAGIAVHRSPLPASDKTTHEGIPVTTVARTLIDLADVVSRRSLERAFDRAEYQRLDFSGLRVISQRRGASLLAAVMAEHEAGTTMTRSALEEGMLALCREAALPLPEVNRHVEENEVDFVWRERAAIVETDGWRAHGTRRAFERDRVRDAELTVAGWRVLRITHARLEREPEAVANQLRRLLRVF